MALVDFIGSLILVVFAIATTIGAVGIAQRAANVSEGMGPGLFPFAISIILLGLGINQTVKTYQKYQANRIAQTGKPFFEKKGDMPRVVVMSLFIVLMLPLINFLGIIIACGLFVAASARFLGITNWAKIIGAGIATSLGTYLVFGKLLEMHLIKGIFGI